MANATNPDIETIDEKDPRNRWPKTNAVCEQANLTKRTLENKVRKREAKYVYTESGERLFDPEWVSELAGVFTETDIEADVTKHVIEQLRRALSDTVRSNKDLLSLATVPAFKAARVVRQENRALRKRCRQLEADRIKSIEAFEAAMTATHDRELARETAKAQESRKDKGFDALLGQLPNLVSQMTGKKTVNSLFESLTADQKMLLFEMLTPSQKAIVARIMKQQDSDNEKRSPAEPADPVNGTGKQAGDTQEETS